MTVKFRNLEVSPDQPVCEWPGEAVLAAIERGSLSDWRRVVREMRREPWGGTARRVEQALQVSQAYGIAPALERALGRARGSARDSERQRVAANVRRLVADSGLSQAEFAQRIGTSASRLSTYMQGRVVPSAALLIRMQDLVARLRSGSKVDNAL